MYDIVVDFMNIFLAALVVGAMFGVWLIFKPTGSDAVEYVIVQQRAIRALNVIMPVLGGVTVLLTVAATVLAQDNRTRFMLLIGAAISFAFAGLITRFLNQPINAIIMTWSPLSIPADWMRLRDNWWQWHVARLIFGLMGLSLLIAATLAAPR